MVADYQKTIICFFVFKNTQKIEADPKDELICPLSTHTVWYASKNYDAS